MALLVCAVAPAALGADVPDYAVKAAYLYKFAEFVEWPPAVFESAESPAVICVASDDTFAAMAENVMRGRKIGGRPVVFQRVKNIRDQPACQILYIAGPDEAWVSQNIRAARGTPVLTITDDARETAAKGIINLVLKDNRVRFEIDNSAAAQNHLTISSKLLSLALRSPEGT
jgi:hypothetical protein